MNDDFFALYKILPQEVVQCSNTTTLESTGLNRSAILAVIFNEGDVLKYFEETAVIDQDVVGIHKMYLNPSGVF